jgi:P-type Ca2+ transporter type 2C
VRRDVLTAVEKMAADGKRVTAYAERSPAPEAAAPEELTFLGCAILDDPIRLGVSDAVAELARAGVSTVMVTGDIPATAAFVARSVGLEASEVMRGQELDALSDAAVAEALGRVQVFARATPEHKLRLVNALKRQGQTVAVTGDGINDAPALSTADVGVAMGVKGTDVAKEAAGLVLADDSFAHLPDAVAIGRKAYENFRKGITYYLSAKAVLLAIFVVPLLVGLPFPLSPMQIIATELLMDLASSTIFVGEQAEPGIMRRRPRPRTGHLTWSAGRLILRNMAGLAIAILAVYFASLGLGYRFESARTAAFATWLLGHIVLALNVKQTDMPLTEQGLFANRFGFGWLVGMVGLVLVMTLLPWGRNALNTTTLSAVQWAMVTVAAILASGWIELHKLLRPHATAALEVTTPTSRAA